MIVKLRAWLLRRMLPRCEICKDLLPDRKVRFCSGTCAAEGDLRWADGF